MSGGSFNEQQVLLGRIAGIVETLPDRFDALDKKFDKLDTKFDDHEKDDLAAFEKIGKRFGKLEKKSNIVTGTVTALTAMAAGLSVLFWHR